MRPGSEIHRLFNRLWSKATGTPGYEKPEWCRLEELIDNHLHQRADARVYPEFRDQEDRTDDARR